MSFRPTTVRLSLIERSTRDFQHAVLTKAGAGESVPSRNAGSGSHPIRIGSEVLARSGPDDSSTLAFSGPDPFGQKLTQSTGSRLVPG